MKKKGKLYAVRRYEQFKNMLSVEETKKSTSMSEVKLIVIRKK